MAKITQRDKGKKNYPKLRAFLDKKNAKLKEEYSKNPKKCPNCGLSLLFKDKRNDFCSKKCYYEFRKKETRIKNNVRETCLFCGERIKKGASTYCSLKCQQKQSWKERKDFFEENGYWEGCNNYTSIRKNNKRYLKEMRGHGCEICKRTEWDDQEIPLVLDHIDGNSANNSLTNLRLVCGNCDMQLPTYKGKNMGNGRHFKHMEVLNEKNI